MAKRNGVELINAKLAEGKNVCVGFDTDPEKISEEIGALIRKEDNLPPSGSVGPLMLGFNKRVIKATKDLICAYKPNLGFYLAQGLQGLWALQETVQLSHKIAPRVPVILDSKSGDMGSSAAQYAKFVFKVIGADAVTVDPWGGYEEGLDEFFRYKDKMIFVWCKGSNKGSGEIQGILLSLEGPGGYEQRLYEFVAELASGFSEHAGCMPEHGWNNNGNCGLVVGATYPGELKTVRRLVGDMPILVPGIGAQGGDLKAAVEAAGPRTLFNSSRGIIYASIGSDFAEAAREEAKRLQDEINKYRKEAAHE